METQAGGGVKEMDRDTVYLQNINWIFFIFIIIFFFYKSLFLYLSSYFIVLCTGTFEMFKHDV